ncbi:uncharacterized protein LOC127288606 [Leptopilina boulardi]|uniref:uncharacterized protein LOC127286850 n=1 Tax=Leptopilina boulardi TaxID=63433 RepID=UPI0021F4FE32|nr:uncharacterized protein LOC127286850 [Leptopilina boulardi]XP_051169410.1 uncharacterized protein LOC127286850 [Leptopilina boulardi]XP_051172112.1 uncharacterized protein LOC127288606 [Leptopilina boulardi]XP_051172113.1 uncharacterized protein LOC127288606 [Leptopilina boulardi]
MNTDSKESVNSADETQPPNKEQSHAQTLLSPDTEIKEVISTMEKLTVKEESSTVKNVDSQPSTSQGQYNISKKGAHSYKGKDKFIKDTHADHSVWLNFKVATQTSRLNLMIESFEQLQKFSSRYSLSELNSMKTIFEDLWTEFSQAHEEIGEKCDNSFFTTPYMTEECFEQGFKTFMDSKITINSLIEQLKQPVSQLTQQTENSQPKRRQLPEISLPKFSGDYSAWTSFRDLFQSLVGQNSEISGVEKMHYLRTSLTDEAAQLIANLPLSSDSFYSAWELLTSRYENKRLLIASQMDKLFNSKIISPKSAGDLNALITTTTESLNALTSLGAPVDSWDLILVHFIIRRLDTQTRESWEVKQGSRTTSPTYKELKDFLTGRARALENMQLNSTQYSQAAKSTASTSTSKSTQSTSKSARALTASHQDYGFACSCCQQSHYIVVCEKFRNLSTQDRREFVKTQRLCYNCLGRHSAHSCQSDKRCRECNGKHHTMIHVDDSRTKSTKDASQSTTTQPAQSDDSSN